MHPPTIVCAVDYSDCSRRALRSAGALTAHFGARLFVLHVADALRLGAVGLEQIMGDKGRDELQPFVAANLHPAPWRGHDPELVVVLGSPAHEIARFADECRADLIVIGSHGYTGARKAFFGSTAREVLRLAQVPVLALPLGGDAAVSSPLIASGPVVAPVDFSAESCAAAHVAAGLARALDLPLVLMHVAYDETGRRWAETALQHLAATLDPHLPIDVRLRAGDPGDEIARIARDDQASVVVMSLASALRIPGQPPGSVAYRVLCHAPSPILALPATPSGSIFISHLHRPGVVPTV